MLLGSEDVIDIRVVLFDGVDLGCMAYGVKMSNFSAVFKLLPYCRAVSGMRVGSTEITGTAGAC